MYQVRRAVLVVAIRQRVEDRLPEHASVQEYGGVARVRQVRQVEEPFLVAFV